MVNGAWQSVTGITN